MKAAEEETLVLCFKELVDGTCTGTSSKFPTRLTVTRDVADDISNPTFAAAFWGDVPDRAVLGSQHTTVTTTDFANATGTPWVIGSPVKRTVQATAAGESSRTTTQTASYFAGTREPAIVTNLQDAGASEYTLSRTLGGGSPNYLSGTALSGASIASRDTSWTVTADHRYPSAVTNALGQTTNFDYDARFGAVSQVSDPDGNLTRWSYDAFSRRLLATSQDGTEVVIIYQRCDVADCSAVVNAEAAFKVTHVTSNYARCVSRLVGQR